MSLEFFTPLAWGVMVVWTAYSLPKINHFAKYGDISYGIYIYHGPTLKILLTIGAFTEVGIWPATIIYIICVAFIGLVSWHFLEKRILKRN